MPDCLAFRFGQGLKPVADRFDRNPIGKRSVEFFEALSPSDSSQTSMYHKRYTVLGTATARSETQIGNA